MKPSNKMLISIPVAVLMGIASSQQTVAGQALTMDGSSGVFFQPWANVVPSSPGRFNGPTLAYHAVTAGPVAGDYFNVSVEEGFGNWLEFGYTRDSHSDGGDPTFSPLFNYAGMNIFNIKAKVIPENFHKQKWIPAVAIGGVVRTNDPYVSQTFAHKNATNGDIFGGVATKLVVVGKTLPTPVEWAVSGVQMPRFTVTAEMRQSGRRVLFGALGIPIRVKRVLFAPTVEIDQEPHHLQYIPYANLPTTEVYAVRMSDYPNQEWAIDIGTGHVASSVYPHIGLKANNALAIAFDYRF